MSITGKHPDLHNPDLPLAAQGRPRLARIALGLVLSCLAPAVSVAGEAVPSVVELFTSQGCSSCPPANENVRNLAATPGVLALSYGVTYWDYIGWKDTFAKEVFTDRQRAYVAPLGNTSPFTPQVVVNGRADIVGNRRAELDALVGREKISAGPMIDLGRKAVTIGVGRAPAGGADIWRVRYDPRTVEVPVRRGENSGRTLPHKNVVRDLDRIGTWTGGKIDLALGSAPKGLKTAILVQTPHGGPILAAATD